MAYLIDSDWIVNHLESIPAAVQLLDQLAPAGLAISMISYMEVYQGVARSPNPLVTYARLQVLIAEIPLLTISRAIAERCADLREGLRRQGRRVRPRALDLLIAATALEYDLTLVSRNRDDYQDIPGLTLY